MAFDIHRKYVQLCGPVTGVDLEERLSVFDAARDRCWMAGACVWSPVDHVPYIASHSEAMETCLGNLLSGNVDALVVLPGWESSRGASLEVAVARAIGVPVVALDDVEVG